MTAPFISYLVTTKNGTNQLKDLLELIRNYMVGNECVVLDDYSDNEETLKILDHYSQYTNFFIHKHALDNHYSNHKNFGKTKCNGKYIFQIDDDELPNETLLDNLKDIIDANPSVECFLVPRLNNFIGVTEAHASQWGWRLTYNPRPSINDKAMGPFVNWPDYQFRIFKNLPHLRWERPLHEKVEGAMVITKLPEEVELSLLHTKTIEKQVQTNLRYNRDFSKELNKGFVV
jgi:glycosyltransferase involved in cell wall biosynthesis